MANYLARIFIFSFWMLNTLVCYSADYKSILPDNADAWKAETLESIFQELNDSVLAQDPDKYIEQLELIYNQTKESTNSELFGLVSNARFKYCFSFSKPYKLYETAIRYSHHAGQFGDSVSKYKVCDMVLGAAMTLDQVQLALNCIDQLCRASEPEKVLKMNAMQRYLYGIACWKQAIDTLESVLRLSNASPDSISYKYHANACISVAMIRLNKPHKALEYEKICDSLFLKTGKRPTNKLGSFLSYLEIYGMLKDQAKYDHYYEQFRALDEDLVPSYHYALVDGNKKFRDSSDFECLYTAYNQVKSQILEDCEWMEQMELINGLLSYAENAKHEQAIKELRSDLDGLNLLEQEVIDKINGSIYGNELPLNNNEYVESEIDVAYQPILWITLVLLAAGIVFGGVKYWQFSNLPKEVDNSKLIKLVPHAHDQLLVRMNMLLERKEIICDPDLTLEIMAAMLNSYSSELVIAIARYYRTSFSNVLNHRRVQLFCEFAQEGESNTLNIEYLAREVGFTSTSEFYRNFKLHYDCTPTEFCSNLAKTGLDFLQKSGQIS